ncbi:MAG: anti-sigma factor [Acidimicrobiia bacterium]|nr:anti-sigma factor [Acidimicrobiia bacterium]
MDAERELRALRGQTSPGEKSDELTMRIGRAALRDHPGPLVEPPGWLWDAIAAATVGEAPEGGALPERAGAVGGFAPVVPIEQATGRRSRRWWPVPAGLAAAAALLVAVVVVRDPGSPGGTPEGPVIASARLEPLEAPAEVNARAEVHDGATRILDLDVSNLAPSEPGSFHELWLIDRDVTKLVSLGPLRPDGRYVVPDGLDLATYPVVDVSTEPIDGDTSHSGHSVLRGVLEL